MVLCSIEFLKEEVAHTAAKSFIEYNIAYDYVDKQLKYEV